MSGFVYKWINTINNKWYIGSHKGTVCDAYVGSGKVFIKAYKKHKDSFIREIIYTGEHFIEVEDLILKTLDALNDRMSYNMKNSAIGGDTSMYFTEESKRKMSEASKSMKGKKVITKEARLKTSNSLKGRVLPEEVKIKISEATKGSKNHFYGKKHSAESIRKISEANKGRRLPDHVMKNLHDGNQKKIICLDNNIIFDSIKETALFFGKSNSYISNMLAGRSANKYNIHKLPIKTNTELSLL